MKKLMIAAAIVCAAALSQASVVNWQTTANMPGIDVSKLAGNGTYGTAGDLKGTNQSDTKYMYSLYVYTMADALVGKVENQEVKFGATNKKISTNGITIGDDTAIAAGTTYQYEIVISGYNKNVDGIKGEWDYSDALITSDTIKGTFTGASGTSTLQSNLAKSWTVSGAVAVPEPTSGLLLLLGVAGMALRRRRA